MKTYTVSQINRYIRGMFSQDVLLNAVAVEGEVSNCKYHSSRHVYFSLKDAQGAISCVMFARDRAAGLRFPMKDGDRVVISGAIDVYEKSGVYQLYAREIRQAGAGKLYEQFLALKKELGEMGMFDPSYKLPIPKYARTIGVVTAPTGAAIRDIQNISRRRNPYVQLILYPALVQGEGAKASIVSGIRALDAYGVDVIIVGRGGGSLEDLWAFNEREVAEAIFACRTPVISAVGHETDVTISDFVADLRAPTPSAAAELAVFDYRAFEEDCRRAENTLRTGALRALKAARSRSEVLRAEFSGRNPVRRIRDASRRAADLEASFREAADAAVSRSRVKTEALHGRMEEASHQTLETRRRRLLVLIERMRGLNPLDRLKQGYAYLEDEDGKNIRCIGQVSTGTALTVSVTDGRIFAEVTGIQQYPDDQ